MGPTPTPPQPPTPAVRPDVELWFDFASTYAYPAVMLAEQRAPDGVKIRWRPFLLGPIFADQGWGDSPFNLYPAKGRYMWRDLERVCADEGLPFLRPRQFPQHSLAAARIALVGLEQGWGAAFIRALYLMHFSEQRDIADPAILARAVSEAHGDPEDALARAQSQGIKDRLRDQVERARNLGLFGTPTFTVGDELFWGFDRMQPAFAWAAGLGDAT